MDLLIRTIWPNKDSNNDISIPQYKEGEDEDNVDLKVKALTYLFKRLNIENLSHFNPTNEFELDDTVTNHDKLDQVYSIGAFLVTFTHNEHRILVDWYKNRFRSLMILSDVPESANIHEKLGRDFRFQILRSESTEEQYVKSLINSDLYIEHSIPLEIKIRLATQTIDLQKKQKPSYKKMFNKSDRAHVIEVYLEKLSQYVQIDRIYQVSLLQRKTTLYGQIIKEEERETEINSGASTVSHRAHGSRSPRSQTRRLPLNKDSSSLFNSVSPVRKSNSCLSLSSNGTHLTASGLNHSTALPPTASRSRSISPVKSLRKKASMTLLKMDNTLNNRQELLKEDETVSSIISNLTKEETDVIYGKSEVAVKMRVERERKVLLKGDEFAK